MAPLPDWSLRQSALDAEGVSRFNDLAEDWTALRNVLRDEPAFGLSIVEADSVAVLGQWFSPRDGGWSDEPDRSGMLGENSFGAAWLYRGVHNIQGTFNGLPATRRQVTVRGFTVIGPDPEGRLIKARIRRYIDWAGLFAQMGLTLNWRVPLRTRPSGNRPAHVDSAAGG
jgi:hypothetical protein